MDTHICKEMEDYFEEMDNSSSIEIFVDEEDGLWWLCGGCLLSWFEIHVGYCPFCGVKLE